MSTGDEVAGLPRGVRTMSIVRSILVALTRSSPWDRS